LRRCGRLWRKLKQAVRKSYGTVLGFSGRGEMIPNPDSFCEIDPGRVDQWGIPTLSIHFKWSDNEIKMAKDMQQTFRSIVEAAGGTYLTKTDIDGDNPYGIEDGGVIIHEIGTARMERSEDFSPQRLIARRMT